MKTNKIVNVSVLGFILISALSLLSISLMALMNPQSVMDLVHVQLPNTDASSSIRGVYGGVGLTIFISLIYLMIKKPDQALWFLMLFWGSYAFSRTLTIFIEGALGDFGYQWLLTETVLFLLALGLIFTRRKISQK